MCTVIRSGWAFVFALVSLVSTAAAQDWPQWRGPNRDAKASSFNAPETWPKELSQKWKVTVGDGVSTPAVVGDRVYVHARQEDEEVIRCLNAANGEELWQDKNPAEAPRGPASGFAGPRSSPAVANDKVVTLGVGGTLSCYDATAGKLLWRKNEFGGDLPGFAPASSPIIVDGMCIAQLGGREEGGIVAFDLSSGNEKWRWTEYSPAYGSPVQISVGQINGIVAPTERNLVVIAVADGKQLWEIPLPGRYNASTPIVSGDTIIVAVDTSIIAFKLKMQGDVLVEDKLWSNTENPLIYNTPVLTNNLLFGLSNSNQLFCINTENGEATAWAAPIARPAPGAAGEAAARGVQNNSTNRVRATYVQAVQEERRDREGRGERRGFDRERRRGEGRGGFGGGGRGRGGRGGGGRGGYGSVVDAGSALLALSPAGELVVFKPSDTAYAEVARYKVAEEGTYAYPVAVGDAIYIKDRESLTRWGVK